MNLLDLIAGVFKPAAELIDELHTSEEERLQQKSKLLDVQAKVIQSAIDYEKETTIAKANIIKAEAKSEHVITATWRPITMLTFLAILVADYTFYMTGGVSLLFTPELAGEMWTLLQIGLGGYVVSRGGEKIAKGIIESKVTGK